MYFLIQKVPQVIRKRKVLSPRVGIVIFRPTIRPLIEGNVARKIYMFVFKINKLITYVKRKGKQKE